MNIEAYITKHYKRQSDQSLAYTFRTTPGKIAMIRRNLGLYREPKGVRNLQTTTEAERKAWYKGTFNPHETEWYLSGMTK